MSWKEHISRSQKLDFSVDSAVQFLVRLVNTIGAVQSTLSVWTSTSKQGALVLLLYVAQSILVYSVMLCVNILQTGIWITSDNSSLCFIFLLVINSLCILSTVLIFVNTFFFLQNLVLFLLHYHPRCSICYSFTISRRNLTFRWE